MRMRPTIRVARSGLAAAGLVVAALVASVVPAGADIGTFQCTTTIGGSPALVRTTDGAISIGGCRLVTLKSSSRVRSIAPAAGCHIEADTDADMINDVQVRAGMSLPRGSAVWAVCDPGVTNAKSKITF